MSSAPPSAPARLALIGSGAIAARYLEAIETHPDAFELVAVCDPNEAAVERARARFPGVRAFSDVRALVAAGGFDGAIVATPHHLHFDQAATVAQAGIGVLVEKPLVTSTDQMRRLRAIAETSGAVVLAGQTRRHAAESILTRDTVADPVRFGDLQSFDIQSFQDLRPYVAAGGSRGLLDGGLAGGGVTISLAIHQIDLVRFLTGLDYVAVSATAAFDRPFVNGAESRVAASLELSNGALGTLHANYLATRIPFAEALTLIGEHGSVAQHADLLGQYRGPMSAATSDGLPSARFDEQLTGWERVTEPSDAQEGFTRQLLHFAAVLAGREQPIGALVDNFNTIACVEGILTSARTGGRVEIERW